MRYLVPEDRFRTNGYRAAAQREQAMTTLVRSVIAVADAKLNPGTRPAAYLRQKWGEHGDAVAMLLKAATAPAMTTVTGWAAELSGTTTAFLEALTPISAGADLLTRALKLSFDGAKTINIPAVSMPLADFVAEGAPIPVVGGVSSAAHLDPHKFGNITVLSREVLEAGNAETLVREVLLAGTGPSLDRRLFDNVVGTNVRPSGLLFGKTSLTPSASTDKLAAMIADLSALGEAVAPVSGNSPVVLIAAPKQAIAATLATPGGFPYPLATSTGLPAGTVICVAPRAIVFAAGLAPAIDTTRSATLHMDDNPSLIASGGTMAAPITATFQTDTIGVRLRWPISWSLRDSRGVAFISGAQWP
jgi:hypothetical protein